MDPYSQFFGQGGLTSTSGSTTGSISLGGISFGATDPVTQLIVIGAAALALVYIVGRK